MKIGQKLLSEFETKLIEFQHFGSADETAVFSTCHATIQYISKRNENQGLWKIMLL
jgi:hypothetical protein